MEDFLFDGLPVVSYKDKYIIFSYYNGKIASIEKDKFKAEEVSKFLKEQNMLGEPKSCPGDYSNYVELVISLTNDCNLRCKYCFVGEKNFCKKIISKENIDNALEAVKELAKIKNKDEVFITFFRRRTNFIPRANKIFNSKSKRNIKGF